MNALTPTVTPRERRPGACCPPPVHPDLGGPAAVELARVAKALADPTRLRILDTLRKAAPEAVCQCELVPLFDMSQPALAKHLKVLMAAGLVASERRGLWTYYHPVPEATKELTAWLD